ncbi:hypothetical protein V2J09_008805 [Rumex salicifolius]
MDPKVLVAVLIAALVAAAAAAPSAYAGGESEWVQPLATWRSRVCDGSVGDCIDLEEETMMESEGAHRQLWDSKRYISYSAMKKNSIPCNQAGNSYYNCRGNNAANPYRRGCTAITNCARTW